MKPLLWLLAVSVPAFSQTIPEPRPLRGVVTNADIPPSYAGKVEAWAVLSVDEDNGRRSTFYMYYGGAEVPRSGQRCVFDIGPGFVKGLVGRDVWSKGRHVTALLRADCEDSQD